MALCHNVKNIVLCQNMSCKINNSNVYQIKALCEQWLHMADLLSYQDGLTLLTMMLCHMLLCIKIPSHHLMIVKVKNNSNTGISYKACVLQLNTLEILLESQMV